MAVDAPPATVTLTIDGREVVAPKGMTVLQAANLAGIEVPTLCDHEILEPVGACRMCVVEIAPGPPRPMASCTTPAADGMTVKTNTDEMQRIRRQTIELLLQHHPLDCPYCDQSGTCELQDETFGLNIWNSPFETESKAFPEENLNEVIMINHNRCILCYRCVRVCDEQMGVHALDVSERGSKSFIVTAQHKFMDCERCGMCVEVCPVGAVLSRPFKHNARAWQTEQTQTTCPHCSVGCQLQIESRKGQVLRSRARPVTEPNRGILCGKGFFGWEHANSPDRITTPLIRRAGSLVEVPWGEAISHVGDLLLDVSRREGPESIAIVAGNELSSEDAYAFARLGRGALGTPHTYQAESGFARAADEIVKRLGRSALFPSQDELLASDFALFFGADVNGTHNVLAAHAKAAARKGQMTYATASRVGSGLDIFASQSVRVRPGSEAALLAALADPDGPDAAASGIQGDQLRSLAKALGDAERPFLVWDTGAWTRGREASIAAAACRLASSCGARLSPLPESANAAGVWLAGIAPDLNPGRTPADSSEESTALSELWGTPVAGIGRPLPDLAAAGELSLLYLAGLSDASQLPGGADATAAIETARTLIVQATHHGPLTDLADIVLPGAVAAEKNGHLVSFEGRANALSAATPPTGDAHADWEIAARLAAYCGADFGHRDPKGLWTELSLLVDKAPTAAMEPETTAELIAALPEPTAELPLLLANETNLFSGNSDLRRGQVLSSIYEDCVEIGSTDAGWLGLSHGDRATLKSANGAVEVAVKVDDRVPDGIVYLADGLASAPGWTLGPGGADGHPVSLRRLAGVTG